MNLKSSIKKYAFEFFLIFISITVSFSVEEWRSNRSDQALVRQFLARFKDELKSRTIRTRNFLQSVKNNSVSSKKIFYNFKDNRLTPDSLLFLIATSESFGTIENKFTTWESLLASGKLASVNPAIIDSVNTLLVAYTHVNEDMQLMATFSNTLWADILADLPSDKYVSKLAVHYMDKQGDASPVLQSDMTPFLKNAAAVDYYSSKYWLTNDIVTLYYHKLPAREQNLIALLDAELNQ